MPILTTADFPSVRAALDLSLDILALPDATIALPIFQGSGESLVVLRCQGANPPIDLSGGSGTPQQAKNAAIYYTAGYLAPALPQLSMESYTEYRYQRETFDRDEMAARCFARGDEELDQLLAASSPTAERAPAFALAHGTRGALGTGANPTVTQGVIT